MSSERPRRWVTAIAIGWGVILAGGVVWATVHGRPTSRDQTSIAQAQPVVDEAVARIVTAATQDGLAVAAIGDFSPGQPCDVTPVRGGGRYQRYVDLLVAPGTEAALLQRIADRLPASYHAAVSTSGGKTTFSADAGTYVLLSGAVPADGQVHIVADTGGNVPFSDNANCRVVGDLPAPTVPVGVDRAPVDAVLAKLALTGGDPRTYAVACPAGGQVDTLVVTADRPAGQPAPAPTATASLGYQVARGDSLAAIAARFLGDPTAYARIEAVNPSLRARPDHLESGWVLGLPTDALDGGTRAHAVGTVRAYAAPVSGAPVSAAPVSGAPVAGAPVAGASVAASDDLGALLSGLATDPVLATATAVGYRIGDEQISVRIANQQVVITATTIC